jgi:hypothetical protein
MEIEIAIGFGLGSSQRGEPAGGFRGRSVTSRVRGAVRR